MLLITTVDCIDWLFTVDCIDWLVTVDCIDWTALLEVEKGRLYVENGSCISAAAVSASSQAIV